MAVTHDVSFEQSVLAVMIPSEVPEDFPELVDVAVMSMTVYDLM